MGALEYSGGLGILVLVLIYWVWDDLWNEGPKAALKDVLVIFGFVFKYVAGVLGLIGSVAGSIILFAKLPFAREYPTIMFIASVLVGIALFVKVAEFLDKKMHNN